MTNTTPTLLDSATGALDALIAGTSTPSIEAMNAMVAELVKQGRHDDLVAVLKTRRAYPTAAN